MKLLLAILPFLSCTAALSTSPVKETRAIKSTAATTKVTIQSMLKNIWNNGGEQTTENYKYNVGYGRLTWGDQEVQGFFPATKNTASEGNFDGDGGPIVDWGGDRLVNTVANEMFMFKIKAINDIEIKFGGDGEGALAGWVADSQLNFYVIEGDIQNERWYSDKLVKTVNMTAATTYADISYTATVKAGNTFVFEWGAHEASGRNWQNFAKMYFEFERLATEETYPMSTIVSDVITSGGSSVSKAVASYNVKHGSVAGNNVKDFDGTSGALTTLSGDAKAENWKIQSLNNDGIIFVFDVLKNSTFEVSRERLGNEWMDPANVNIYLNGGLVKSTTLVSGNTSQFTYKQFAKAGDEIAWEFVFPYGGDHRSIAMESTAGGDIVASMPKFKFTELMDVDSQMWAQSLTNGIVCDQTGESAPTWNDGVSWRTLKSMYQALSDEEQAKLKDATYISTTGSLIVEPTGDTTQEVANAMYIYDILTSKYSTTYENFMNRGSLLPRIFVSPIFENGVSIELIIVVSVVAFTGVAAFFFFRKRKEN